ncbi:hypothetical protein ABZ719_18595 [Streptomyces sp. NPDC006743]|uniref:hypothetical protein n=1 Tax=Streptomyces sp. NPDC006743 TaxID=3154480 RepID=UPI0034542F4C
MPVARRIRRSAHGPPVVTGRTGAANAGAGLVADAVHDLLGDQVDFAGVVEADPLGDAAGIDEDQ